MTQTNTCKWDPRWPIFFFIRKEQKNNPQFSGDRRFARQGAFFCKSNKTLRVFADLLKIALNQAEIHNKVQKLDRQREKMASTAGLVPITRAFLASYYDKYQFPPLSDDVSRLCGEIHSMSIDLLNELPANEGFEYFFQYRFSPIFYVYIYIIYFVLEKLEYLAAITSEGSCG